ncbi:MAG: hypothetical protein LUG15_06095, partial [Oscillospiraceae bacterium]|nr:hypothetical protein [Oscillospiraceae bacterium]
LSLIFQAKRKRFKKSFLSPPQKGSPGQPDRAAARTDGQKRILAGSRCLRFFAGKSLYGRRK